MIILTVMIEYFFQEEDGMRDVAVTGVQTCALPIFDDDGLAGPGLAGEDVQARRKDDARLLQDGQVPDGELAEHRGRHATMRGWPGSSRIHGGTGPRHRVSNLALPPLE